jgi:N-acetylneuraminic acid mutarotase
MTLKKVSIMLKVFLILKLLIFYSVIEIKSQNTFTPLKRGGHTAALINKKLYILGGYSLSGTDDEISGQEFFYLDFSESFVNVNTEATEAKWVDLTSINLAPPHRRAAGAGCDDKIFLFGGEPITRSLALVYIFDTVNLSWSTPKLTGSYHPLSKSGLVPIVNGKKIYYFGGYVYYNNSIPNRYVDDMVILDTVSLSFTKGSTINPPTPRGYYGAVLLPNQKILYFGKKKVFF